MHLKWLGGAPPPTLRRELGALGVTLQVGARAPEPHVVAITSSGRGGIAGPAPTERWLWLPKHDVSDEQRVEATLAGAHDVIPCLQPGAAQLIARRAAELLTVEENRPVPAKWVAEASVTRRALLQLARAARTSMPVLITGETGTGKEVAARQIHEWSSRAARAFIAINCAAIPNDLIEAELFGYAKGAFSGAVHQYDGQLTAAEGGTVLLDEVDDTPLTLQNKLLRVLEDRVVSRLGENEWHQVNFRIVATTNRDLEKLVNEGTFGADLFERLAIVRVHLPPLRERVEDIAPLCQRFVARFREEEPDAQARVHAISPSALRALEGYPWPGNVRELRNTVFGSLVAKRCGDELLLSDLPQRILRKQERSARPLVDSAELGRRIAAGHMNLRQAVQELEREAIELALTHAGGKLTGAARLLGELGRGAARDPSSTLRAMCRRLGVRS